LLSIGLLVGHHLQKRACGQVFIKLTLILACQCGRRSLGFAMRQLIFFAVALVVAGSYMARFADRAVEARPEPQAAVLEPVNDLREPTTSGRSLMLESDRQGHFQVEARVEGRFVDFVVDTGASLVVLRESSRRSQVFVRSRAITRLRPSPTTAGSRPRRRRSIVSKSAVSRSMMCRRWFCQTKSCRKTCSASRFGRGCGVTNTPTVACCWNSNPYPRNRWRSAFRASDVRVWICAL
jgi:hypothetical protein